MRIGIVTTWFERGAAYVSKQYREVLKEDHEVFLYVRGGEKYALNDPNWDVENIYWGKRYKYIAGSRIHLEDFKYWISKNKVDVIFFNEQHSWEPIILCNKLGIKVGAYIDYYKKETVPLFNSYDFVVCNTKRHYSAFREHQQAFYIPWGSLPNIFKPQDKPDRYKDKIVFFHSAGMNPKRKGTDLVIKAISELKREDFKIVIHSQVELLDFFPGLKGIINSLVISGKMEVIKETITAPGIYHYGDVYVYPTRLEGIGLTVSEALACGLPVITTNQAPMSEFVTDGVNGKLVDVKEEVYREDNYYWPQSIVSVSSLKSCMEYYLSNKNEITEFKRKARDYAIEHLDWVKNANALGQIFKETVVLNSDEKETAIAVCAKSEKSWNMKTYLNSFLPYVHLKRKIKRLLK